MFSLLQNVHTYLVISFVVMLIALFKFGYKKLDNQLNKGIENIKFTLNDLESKKIAANEQIIQLKKELQIVNDEVSEAISKAEQTAKEITEKSNKDIEQILKNKQAEYDMALKRIEQGFLVELKNKLVSLILNDLEKKLKEGKESRELQNDLIENSIENLETLVTKYIKHN
ncbi:MAG: ATP synthase F0 subunit B [Alphaproteobacteria bacterium]|nr:ATP synthase F0 subunit B [Alphaproteobacteria bacterium]